MVDIEIDPEKMWSEEERQEYMDNLPEMSLFDDHILPGDEMVEAIQALIKDGETNESLALHWKNKGNELFSDAKNINPMYYDNALQYYNDAMGYALKALETPEEERDENIDMPLLISQILSNRAAVHLEKKNYGRCRSDAAVAIKYDPTNVKAYFRGAKASRVLRRPEDTLRYCEQGLKHDPSNKLLLRMQKEGLKLVEQVNAERQQKEFERQKKRAFTNKYRQLCVARNVRVGPAVVSDERVKHYEGKADLDPETGGMVWPVLFLYQEYGTSDFVQTMGEQDLLLEHLANMFPEDGPFCEWDVESKYKASNLEIYAAAEVVPPFETEEEWHVALSGAEESDEMEEKRLRKEELQDAKMQQWLHVSPFCRLQELLAHEKYVVPGVVVLHIFAKESTALHDFLDKIEHKTIEVNGSFQP